MSTIVWHEQKIGRGQHELLNGHRGLCIWFTGLSGAGKSTLANALEQRLYEEGVHTYLLDGDNVRHGLNEGLGFDKESRQENVRRVAHVAKLFTDAGVVAITALISPFRDDRARAREIISSDSFLEVYVQCPVEVCITRDPKGLYERAKSGVIKEFTGVSSPYEPPSSPDIMVNTSEMSINDCIERIVEGVKSKLYQVPNNQ
ncbi:adenylyl-sulfate kinase [Alicyclobacillus fastidiosus]|uniref:Adenylyl-sulfate kinase n=1 Tax=Alicyclobacillus fastidiosus TaxID=392011 RepID=A0ABY6ZQI1_9BACL|nr:adenylyl-sulfate kinase [Alicyclobacillus fastidiosus]WAH44707.1 adenylyl-sulfate kinase [Alicyclobacillus fastidiosus]GMA62503.1 adenylyl-sulfate kinase [Alicyclobacillus fastidiosus]